MGYELCLPFLPAAVGEALADEIEELLACLVGLDEYCVFSFHGFRVFAISWFGYGVLRLDTAVLRQAQDERMISNRFRMNGFIDRFKRCSGYLPMCDSSAHRFGCRSPSTGLRTNGNLIDYPFVLSLSIHHPFALSLSKGHTGGKRTGETPIQYERDSGPRLSPG